MKFTGGNSYYVADEKQWKSNPRIYTDFHCNLNEWKNLSKGKYYFVAQLLNKVAEERKLSYNIVELKNGIQYKNIIFNDELQDENIIHDCIKLVTKAETEVIISHHSDDLYIDVQQIYFKDYKGSMPMIRFSDSYIVGETDYIKLIAVILDAIYMTLGNKKYSGYKYYYEKYYNSNYFIEFQTDCTVNGFGLYTLEYNYKFLKRA